MSDARRADSPEMPPEPSAFYRWLIKQKDREEPIGDLAGDVLRDRRFPCAEESVDAIYGYIRIRNGCREALEALQEAWDEFCSKKSERSKLTLKLRYRIFQRDWYACQICGGNVLEGKRLEIDHKVPVAKGGKTIDSNLWVLCFECNRGKGADDL